MPELFIALRDKLLWKLESWEGPKVGKTESLKEGGWDLNRLLFSGGAAAGMEGLG